ncbi:MAG: GFA family protein [Alphaproteobacteria bacterium]|nr:GFA family protein [Alphaproteobacteria bacterium]
MQLEGSCHCGGVRFSLASRTPTPYMRCYCSICRKTAGGGGYAINIMGEAGSLKIEGEENIAVYQAKMPGGKTSPAGRSFCKQCGSALWLSDPRWPDGVWPLASAVDTDLPIPPEQVNMMLAHAPAWTGAPDSDGNTNFAEYPELSIEDWHKNQRLLVD